MPRRREETLETRKARKRVIIEGVTPEVDGGRFPIKRTVGEVVVVEADAFTDGHDALTASCNTVKRAKPLGRKRRCSPW